MAKIVRFLELKLAYSKIVSRAQKNLLSACRESVTKHAKTLLNTNEDIDLLETILLSMDGSKVRQTPHAFFLGKILILELLC